MNGQRSKPTVVVAMSGGVDSSVAAALLLEEGYRVIGVTMKTYDFDEVGGNVTNETSCCGVGAMNDARAVAAMLGIPHYVVDFREAFNREVIENFVSEYVSGRTPNPCVICNREIKWGKLLRKAQALGADKIATGHYARVRYDEKRRRHIIARGAYGQKDQSYALWGLGQEALGMTLFPLGEMRKPDVRELASKYNLRNANKAESYEICFVADYDHERFLKERVPGLEGNVSGGRITWDGKEVGTHNGYPFYTIGQRKGVGAFGEKVYVTGINSSTNTIEIGRQDDLLARGLLASKANWVKIDRLTDTMDVAAKVRYNDTASSARVMPADDGAIRVEFSEPKRAITPGQSVVLYDGDDVVGGAVIDSVFRE